MDHTDGVVGFRNSAPDTRNPDLRFLPTKHTQAKDEYGRRICGKRDCDPRLGFA